MKLKKNNKPLEEVLLAVAEKNGLEYLPPEKRTPIKSYIVENMHGDFYETRKTNKGFRVRKVSKLYVAAHDVISTARSNRVNSQKNKSRHLK